MNAVTARVQDLTQREPQKIYDWNHKYAAKTEPPASLDDLCKLYDQMLADLN
jgi:hypothetical protein